MPARLAARFAILLTALLAGAPARAQPVAVLEGTTLSAGTGEPLPYASALATSLPDSARRATALANRDGVYRLQLPRAGRWALRIDYLGYAPLESNFDIAPGDTLRRVDRLQVEAIVLEKQDVTAERDALEKEIQAGLVDYEGEELARLPAFAEADPVRALQLLPGVSSASDVSSGLYIRGGSPDQNLFLLDGVPVYNPTHAFGLFSSFHPDLIDDLVLYKGAYPAEYGGRLGSVLELRSRRGGADDGDRIRGKAGISTVSGRLLLEGGGENWKWVTTGRRTWLDPLLDALRRSEPSVPAYAFSDLNGVLSYEAGGRRTTLRLFRSQDDLELVADESTRLELGWGNRMAQLEHRQPVGDNSVLSGRLWWSRYRSDNSIVALNTPAQFENGVDDIGGEARWLQAREGGSTTLGLEGRRYDFRFAQEFNRERDLDYRGRPFEMALWGEELWRFEGGSRLRLGLRGRWFEEADRWLLEPRASAQRPLGRHWSGRVSAGVYHQVVQLVSTEGFSAADFYLPLDGTVSPSRSYQLATGLTRELGEAWRFSVDVYGSLLEDLVLLDTDAAVDQASVRSDDLFRSGGTGWSAGAEFFLERRLGPLTGWLGYTLAGTRREFADLNGGEPFPPKYDRRHDISLVSSWRPGPWELSASFVYGTGQAFTPASARYGIGEPGTGQIPEGGEALAASRNSGRLLPYHRLDLSVGRRFGLFGLDARWALQVFNAYSRRNDWYVDYQDGEPSVVQQLPVIPSFGLEFDF